MKILSYSQFISESFRIPLVRDTGEVIDGVLSEAKKAGIIKYFINSYQLKHGRDPDSRI